MPENSEIRPGEQNNVSTEKQEDRKGYPRSRKSSVPKISLIIKTILILLIVLAFLYIYLHGQEFQGRKGWMDLSGSSWRTANHTDK